MIAVTYWEGWVLAHPAAVLIAVACAGTLAVLVLLMRAEDRRDDRDAGILETPRREARNRARGTRARRPADRAARRRAGTILALAWTRARQQADAHVRGITIDVTGRDGNRPGTPSTAASGGQHYATAHATVTEGTEREHGPAGDLTEPYEPTEAEDAYMAGHHPAAMLTVGPPGHPETPANAPEQPRTAPDACEHGWPGADCGEAHPYQREPARLATGAERDAPWYAPEGAALSPWEHQTQWFSLDAIDADIRAREAAAAGGDA